MKMAEDPLLITAPFGAVESFAQSPKYFWDNSIRGKVPFVIIQQTLQGEGIFTFQGKSQVVPAGHAFIAVVPEKSSYCYPPDGSEAWTFAWLNFYGALGVSLTRDFRLTYGAILPLPKTSVAGSLFTALVAQAERRQIRDSHDMSIACFSFLMEWKRLLDQPERNRMDRMQLAKHICQTRFREPFGIKEIASQIGLTREHFTRLFTMSTGVSPARYLRDLRLQAAEEILALQSIPLKEVALRCGFPSTKALKLARTGQD